MQKYLLEAFGHNFVRIASMLRVK